MANINILYVGEPKDDFIRSGINEFEKRIGAFAKVKNICIKPQNPPEDPTDGEIEAALEKESVALLEKLSTKGMGRKIALCVEGKQYTSEEFASLIDDSLSSQADVTLVIGSSHGLSEKVKKACDVRLSFSKMTFPHALARLVLTEQIYRAFTIIHGRKYHK
ncbi:MAG: 23S rRNA (pseudouridine(1915)-N(3))-methyltransferase RlmH [Ruminococcaceae bacterium]|nr:23S rRNA (pseudouridine(1915)-N(3))-methyltransferase RlmH [Oscillospiraceae bacterium]